MRGVLYSNSNVAGEHHILDSVPYLQYSRDRFLQRQFRERRFLTHLFPDISMKKIATPQHASQSLHQYPGATGS